jgi:hypothetical protein
MATKASEKVCDHSWALANGKIAKVPNGIFWADRLVPPLHHSFVHRCHRGERPSVKSQSAAMAEVRVAGEKDRHAAPGRLKQS